LAEQVISGHQEGEKTQYVTSESSATNGQIEELKGLTGREREILDLMLDNYSNTMIAEKLFLHEHTVRNYVSKIYDTLAVHNRADLVLWAIDRHLK